MQIRGIKGTDISGEITAEGKCIIEIKTSLKTAEKLLNEVKKEKEYNVEIKQYRKSGALTQMPICGPCATRSLK